MLDSAKANGIDTTGARDDSLSRDNAKHEWYKKMFADMHKIDGGPGQSYISFKYKPNKSSSTTSSTASTASELYRPKDNYLLETKYVTPNKRKLYSSEVFKKTEGETLRLDDLDEFSSEAAGLSMTQPTKDNSKTSGNLARLLSEDTENSSGNVIYKREKNSRLSPLSAKEQRDTYLKVQSGEVPPLYGFRKTLPEAPKTNANKYIESEVNIQGWKTPVSLEKLDEIPKDVLDERQARTMLKHYEQDLINKAEKIRLDAENRKHSDFTIGNKSPIKLDRYSDDITMEQYFRPTILGLGKAMFDFNGVSQKELSLTKGDIVLINKKIDNNWYECEFGGNSGMVPAKFLQVMSSDRNSSKMNRRAIVKFNFNPQTKLELRLRKGEEVQITRQVDQNWFEGKLKDAIGIFPVSYVQVVEDVPNVTPSSTKAIDVDEPTSLNKNIMKPLNIDTALTEYPVYKAAFNYSPQNADELELREGDLIRVMECCSDGWYIGSSQRTGCFGTFPGNYVQKL